VPLVVQQTKRTNETARAAAVGVERSAGEVARRCGARASIKALKLCSSNCTSTELRALVSSSNLAKLVMSCFWKLGQLQEGVISEDCLLHLLPNVTAE